jgi:hypothetical protein
MRTCKVPHISTYWSAHEPRIMVSPTSISLTACHFTTCNAMSSPHDRLKAHVPYPVPSTSHRTPTPGERVTLIARG